MVSVLCVSISPKSEVSIKAEKEIGGMRWSVEIFKHIFKANICSDLNYFIERVF